MLISKSKYCAFWQCPKMAWLNQFQPDDKSIDGSADARMKAGQEVGRLARKLFGTYLDITTYVNEQLDIPAMLEKTKDEINHHTDVICEAAFSYEGNYCAVDILKRNGDGWDIYEVKSSTATRENEIIEPVYAADIAYNGTEAMTIFPQIKDMPEEEQKKARRNLLKYCELDTYAMVKVWEELVNVAGES